MRTPSVLPNAASVGQRRALAERRALLTRHLQSVDDTAAANHHAQRISVLDVDEAVASVACELLGHTGGSDGHHGHARSLTARVAANPGELLRWHSPWR